MRAWPLVCPGLVLDHSPIGSNSFPQSGLRFCKNRLANVLLCHSFSSTLACSEYAAVIVTCACKMTISIQFQFSNLAQIYNAEFHMFKFLKMNYNCQVGKHLINGSYIYLCYNGWQLLFVSNFPFKVSLSISCSSLCAVVFGSKDELMRCPIVYMN